MRTLGKRAVIKNLRLKCLIPTEFQKEKNSTLSESIPLATTVKRWLVELKIGQASILRLTIFRTSRGMR